MPQPLLYIPVQLDIKHKISSSSFSAMPREKEGRVEIFRVIFSKNTTHTWSTVHETDKNHVKGSNLVKHRLVEDVVSEGVLRAFICLKMPPRDMRYP